MNHAPSHDAAHHAAAAPPHPIDHPTHPIGVYLKVWGLLFVLSAMSYAVDYFQAEGIVRWLLIIVFMLLKAGLIVAIFMHLAWERMALIYAILIPPLALGTLVWLMLIESDYTFWTRILFFDAGA
ncbi:MAG TPA: cytochrome C oxidase subunit IV family protein [Allosphingosinicella sp.]|jgi:cytochrome c oxidase subunit 4